jgi:chemotaxis protein CheY-P-specific phosphatase CheC
MSLLKLPNLADSEAVGDAMFAAVQSVSERSFFSVAELCDEAAFLELAAGTPRWLAACVRFEEGPLAGSITCLLPQDLAQTLFDAFAGRESSEPAPQDEIHDLVGEFANMVCGAWLTRFASRQTFTLSQPTVAVCAPPRTDAAEGPHLFVALNDRPLAITLQVQQSEGSARRG